MHKSRLRFREALETAEARLRDRGHDDRFIQQVTEGARALLEQEVFWRKPPLGYCLFATRERTDVYRLPVPPPEAVEVAGRCHLKPLLPLLDDRGEFHLLALQRERIRLYRAGRWAVEEVPLQGVPTSPQQALGFDRPEEEQQFHTGAAAGGAYPGGAGRRPAIFHGQGGKKADRHRELLRFFQVLDHALRPILGEGALPLVLAGSERAVPLYRETCGRPDLVAGEILVNPEDLEPEALRDRAWHVVRDRLQRKLDAARQDFGRLAGSDKASVDLLEVIRAARRGRVRSVLVSLLDTVRGRCEGADPETCRLAEDPRGEDLLNLVAVETLAHGGDAHALERTELPGRSPVAAVFRY